MCGAGPMGFTDGQGGPDLNILIYQGDLWGIAKYFWSKRHPSGGGGQGGDPYKKRLFGTHWCGPGGGGPPINALDSACMAHDNCYDRGGFTPWSNLSLLQDPGLQACNQALCDAARQSNDLGATRVRLYFSLVPKDYCR